MSFEEPFEYGEDHNTIRIFRDDDNVFSSISEKLFNSSNGSFFIDYQKLGINFDDEIKDEHCKIITDYINANDIVLKRGDVIDTLPYQY